MTNGLKTLLAGTLAAATATPALADCFALEQHIPNGPFFGAAIQVDANTILNLVPTQFWWDPATPAANPPQAEMIANGCFGGNASLNLNSTNLTVTIHQREPSVREFQMNFCDFGGFENVSAAPANPPDFIGDMPGVPPALMDPFGDPVNVITSLAPPDGKLVFQSTGTPVTYMRAGGQEFFVHGFCID